MQTVETPSYTYLARAPGRVNLLGEHVDYNGGQALPAAIDRHVDLFFSPRTDRQVRVHADNLQQQVVFSLDGLEKRAALDGAALPGWALYPAGVAYTLRQAGLALSGLDCRFTSDIPMGSGLSSSAAVELAFAAAWNHLAGQPLDPTRLAVLCQQAENRYVGVNCGIMDQFSIARGQAGYALLLDTATLQYRPVPLPPAAAIVIADSGERRSLNHSGYNERRAGCEQALVLLSRHLPGIRTLSDVSPQQLESLSGLLPDPIGGYARHVVSECERVRKAVPLLEKQDAAGFGQLMFECHNSLRDYYRVSTPALDTLVDLASHAPGCLGARLTGAGFGGCTVNLVREADVQPFIRQIKTGYLAATGKEAAVYPCHASVGVRVSSINP
jgi:galactokinase